MKAEELMKRYAMDAHRENGKYLEVHYDYDGTGRAASGSIYYYVAPGEHTRFHKIDCDEYWIYNAGENLELWVIDLEGKLHIKHCGLTEDAQIVVRFAAGEIFASRLPASAKDGCFVTCITVPRFTYEGFQMFGENQMKKQFPETAAFWEK